MIKTLTIVAAGAAVLATGLWAQEETPDHRLRSAASVFHEMMGAPDKGIPRDLLEKAQCVIIVPGLKKAGFVFGADYGKGFAVCRHEGAMDRARGNHFGRRQFRRANWSGIHRRRHAGDGSKGYGEAGQRQIHRWRGCLGSRPVRWAGRALPTRTRPCTLRFCRGRARTASSRGFRWMGPW